MVSQIKNTLPATEPAWDIARLFPNQGMWSESEYLYLTDETNWLVEFTDGCVEVLAMPTISHQKILAFIYGMLLEFVKRNDLGTVLFAALRVRLRPGLIREPDVIFIRKEHASHSAEKFFEGADLVMEIVSNDEKSRHRDLVEKRQEYAEGAIPEYWIVDPQEQRITVLKLNGREYTVHGEWTSGATAESALLPGFHVPVKDVFDAATK